MKLGKYIREVLEKFQMSEFSFEHVEFDIGVTTKMEVNDKSLNRIRFKVK